MDIGWITRLQAEFLRIYPGKRGLAACNAVIPGIMGDFRRTLLAAGEGETIRQEYKTDDKKAVAVTVTGHKRGGACVITRLELNGAPIDLGGAELVI